MSALTFKRQWITPEEEASSVAVTFARLQIFLHRTNITEHRPTRGKIEPHLEVPTYYLAEWMTENWWTLLFEPRKDDEADDTDYLRRHSIVAAQAGFPLPALSIVPTGRGIHLSCSPRVATYANTRFTADAFADSARGDVEAALASFVDATVERLKAHGKADAPFVEHWENLRGLTSEEKQFCELIGSLGTSPDDASDVLCDTIQKLEQIIGFRALRDLCLAVTADDIDQAAIQIEAVSRALAQGNDAALDPLLKADLPEENFSAPSWRRARTAADRVRRALGVDVRNPEAADLLFEGMRIDPSEQTDVAVSSPYQFSGAVAREENEARLVLLQPDNLQRRFAAARGAYLAWVSEAHSKRLVTNAVTRDQQASRAFAAEMLVPQAYLRSLAGPRRELHPDQVRDAARIRRVMPDVAFKQAINAGIRVHVI